MKHYIGQTFRNVKTGLIYKVIGECSDVTNNVAKPVWLYHQYNDPDHLYTRSKDEFDDKFEPYEVG